MKRHLAKAKRKVPKGWIEGYLVESKYNSYILPSESIYLDEYEVVDPKTICRNTGHPNNIYEGDEVTNGYSSGFVEWNDEDLTYRVITHNKFRISFDCITDWKPTGKNIHD